MMRVEGFEPIATSESRVVILGTLPGADSLRLREYYANSRNVFWDIMGEMFGAARSLPYAGRVEILNRQGIALWDVLRSAERTGSTDSKIRKGSEVANNFNKFFREHSAIQKVYFNGGCAEQYFRVLVVPRLLMARQISLRMLASTSPANSHMTKQAKITEWRAIEHD